MEHADKMLEETKNDFQEIQSSARSLDIARNSSIDLASLNNKIVNMRSSVRQAKVRVIHKLTRNMDALKKKKGTEKQLEKLKAKQERLLEEIQVIKSINLDKVSKYALWNTSTLDEVCKQPTSSIQSRALTRLAECCVIQDKVKEFRRCHSDWKSLAAYLVMKQSGRRYKKKKNRSMKNSDVESTNIKARHVMTDTYLQRKLGQGDSDDLPRPDSEENENQLLSDRVTRLPENDGNKSPNDGQDEQNISQYTKSKDESQKKEKSSSDHKKSACLTQRLLKFFPDKTAESSFSDSEDSTSLNNTSSKPKSVTENSRPVDSDTNSENEQCNTKSSKDENVITEIKPVTKRQHEPNVSTGSSVSNSQSDSCVLNTPQTNRDDSGDEINSSKCPEFEDKCSKRKSDSLEVSYTKKRQRKGTDHSSNECSERENHKDKEKLLHSQNKVGSKPRVDASVGNTDKSSKYIPVSKKSSVSDEESSEDDSENDISENGDSKNEDSEIGDSGNNDSENGDSGSSSDDESNLSEDDEDNDMADLCVKKQQQKRTKLQQTSHTPSAGSVSKEMVIKKLNMDTFSGDIDEEDTNVVEDLPGFLISEEQERSSHKKRKNDPFFISSDIEEGDSDKGDNPSDFEQEEQKEASDDERAGYEHIQKARHAFKSDFVDKLGSKGYRRYDWSRQQEDGPVRGRSARRGSMARGRGRGRNRNSRGEQVFEFGHKHSSQSHWQKEKSSFDVKNRKPLHGQPFNKINQPDRRGPPESNETNEVLHPSWEASKRRKEQATIHAFQGKKIKFDD